MDALEDFDLLSCSLIKWRGQVELCVWCNFYKPAPRRTMSLWCSTWCRAQFLQNHSYTTARRICLNENGPKCVDCDQVRPLTCNHKTPVKGKRKGLSCLNHQANLEMLCWECHEKATAEQYRTGLLP
jgi:5-methylcytosine-specific restriction endonuclease McrA